MSNLVTLAILKEKFKKVDFSETIAACYLKLIHLIKICEYLRTRTFIHLDTMSFTHENINFSFQKPLAHFQPNFECKLVSKD